MKKSMGFRFMAVFVIAMAVILIVILGVNMFGLGSYYSRQKTKSMEDAYNALTVEVEQGNRRGLESILQEYSDRENISIALYDTDTSTALVSSERDENVMLRRLQDKLFGREPVGDISVLKETDYYTISKTEEEIEFFGYCRDNRTMVLMSTPIQGMEETAAQSNRFLLRVAIAMLVIGLLAVAVMTRHVAHVVELENDNARLQADLEETERQNRIKQEFISDVSHELKTPLALIQGYAEGLSDGLCEDAESRKYYAGVIVEEAGRMNQIVRQLLMLNSLETGAETVEKAGFDLSELVSGVTESFALPARQQQVALETDIQPGLRAWGDAFRIESVVTNYLSNAVHHVSEGGIIRVTLAPSDAGKIRFAVFNSGNPIPEEAIENIWKKFYKVDKARTREYGGSGIGLSIVKAVMEAHEEPFGVENQEGGVEFWFELTKENDR